MKNTFRLLFIGAFTLLAFISCSEKENKIDNSQSVEYDDSYYASQATVTSSDTNFTANNNGGTINFKTEGGTVTLNVSCGCDWIVENAAADLFTTSAASTSLTVTAEKNTVEEEKTGTITLKTAKQQVTFATITVTQSAYGVPEITVETAEWNAPAKGALTTEIAVTATADWTVESFETWLTAEKTGTGIFLTATENEATEGRNATVQLTCTDGIRTTREYVTVNQDAAVYILLSENTISLGNTEESESITVESNYDWNYSYDTFNGWLTVTRDGNVLTVSSTMNTTAGTREEVITLAAGDGKENVIEALLTVTQASNAAMILTYTISTAYTSIKLPLYGDVDCVVNWGDGSDPETVTTTWPSHIYTKAGEYDVNIEGTVTALYSYKLSSSTVPLIAVKSWGQTGLTDMSYALYSCYTNLKSLPEYTGDAFANVTSFYYAFFSCSGLTEIPAGLFANCPVATRFGGVFESCSSLKSIPANLFANCPEANDFQYSFMLCSGITEIPAELFEKNTKITSFYYTFAQCSSLTSIPAKLFYNCVEATSFQYTFRLCTALKSIPAGLFDNNTKATAFGSIFSLCYALTEIPDRLFANCPLATNFSVIFYECTSLTTIPAGLFENCISASTFQQAFSSCSALTTVPAGLFDSCTEATNFQNIFPSCTKLTSIPVGLFSKNTKVTSFNNAFSGDSAITGESPYDLIEVNGEEIRVHLYEREYYPDIYEEPTGTTGCFKNCTGFDDYEDIPSYWR